VTGVAATAAAARVTTVSHQVAGREAPEAADGGFAQRRRRRSGEGGRGSWFTRRRSHLQIGRRARPIGVGAEIEAPGEGKLTRGEERGRKGKGRRGGGRAGRGGVTGRVGWPWQRTGGSGKDAGRKKEKTDSGTTRFCQRREREGGGYGRYRAEARGNPRGSRARRRSRPRQRHATRRPRSRCRTGRLCRHAQAHGWA
jgi:hypothetical protein